MRSLVVVGVLGVLMTPSSWGIGDFAAYRLYGRVKSLALDADRVIVRIADIRPESRGRVETFRLCNLGAAAKSSFGGRLTGGSDLAAEVFLDGAVQTLKEAMAQDRIVEIEFNSSFNAGTMFDTGSGRCIHGEPRIVAPGEALGEDSRI